MEPSALAKTRYRLLSKYLGLIVIGCTMIVLLDQTILSSKLPRFSQYLTFFIMPVILSGSSIFAVRKACHDAIEQCAAAVSTTIPPQQ